MKASKYNHFFPYTEAQSIAYNGLTNSLALIDNHKLRSYMDFYDNGTPVDEEFAKELAEGKFLLDDFVQELDVLRHKMLCARYRTDSLSMTIAPTNDCQFACVYCYEKGSISHKYMTEEVQDKLVELLESRIGLISNFSVVWYGGEPLMAFDVVESLSEKFVKICEENEIKYSASMITNGHMLTRDILSRMSKLHIYSIQVTIDGLPETHNQMRPLINGDGTFEVIINNLKNGYDLLPPVSLRINIDKDNVSAGEDIYKFLQENNMLDKIRPYFGKIMSEAGTYSNSRCLGVCDFSELHYDFVAKTADNDQGPILYPMLKSAACGADSISSYVIDAEGWIYKCWCDIGIDECKVGSIINDFNPTNGRFYEYMLFDPTTSEPCKDCNVLPLCMGGCPYKRVLGSVDNCSNHKYILRKCLTNAVSFFQNKRIAKHKESAAVQ